MDWCHPASRTRYLAAPARCAACAGARTGGGGAGGGRARGGPAGEGSRVARGPRPGPRAQAQAPPRQPAHSARSQAGPRWRHALCSVEVLLLLHLVQLGVCHQGQCVPKVGVQPVVLVQLLAAAKGSTQAREGRGMWRRAAAWPRQGRRRRSSPLGLPRCARIHSPSPSLQPAGRPVLQPPPGTTHTHGRTWNAAMSSLSSLSSRSPSPLITAWARPAQRVGRQPGAGQRVGGGGGGATVAAQPPPPQQSHVRCCSCDPSARPQPPASPPTRRGSTPSSRKRVWASRSMALGRPAARRCAVRALACSRWNCRAEREGGEGGWEGRRRAGGEQGRREGQQQVVAATPRSPAAAWRHHSSAPSAAAHLLFFLLQLDRLCDGPLPLDLLQLLRHRRPLRLALLPTRLHLFNLLLQARDGGRTAGRAGGPGRQGAGRVLSQTLSPGTLPSSGTRTAQVQPPRPHSPRPPPRPASIQRPVTPQPRTRRSACRCISALAVMSRTSRPDASSFSIFLPHTNRSVRLASPGRDGQRGSGAGRRVCVCVCVLGGGGGERDSRPPAAAAGGRPRRSFRRTTAQPRMVWHSAAGAAAAPTSDTPQQPTQQPPQQQQQQQQPGSLTKGVVLVGVPHPCHLVLLQVLRHLLGL